MPATKTPAVLKTGWEETILEMMKNGKSKQEVKAVLDISNDLHARWMLEEPHYSETIKRGDELCQAWWEAHARKSAVGDNKDANPTMMIFNLKNRFPDDWRDKTEREHSGNVGVTDLTEEELDRKLSQLERENEQSAKT